MLRLFQCAPVLLLVLSAVNAGEAQTTWHVDDDCVAPGTGTQVDPFCVIQDGVNAAEDGDTVLVGSGTYTGDGNRDISLFGKRITLKSSDGPSVTIMDIQGGPTSIHRGFFLIHGETQATVIEGLTITNGYLIGDTGGSGLAGGGGGAGVYIRDSSPVIRNCIVRNNTSAHVGQVFVVDGRGAGIYIDGNSAALIESCALVSNSAEKRGGGMYIRSFDSSVTIRNCLISANAGSNGGGIHNRGATTTIANTTIVNNTAGFGGGIKNEQGEPFLSNCIVWGNQAVGSGPQIFAQGSVLTFEHSNVGGGLDDVGACCNSQIVWGDGMIDADPLFADPENGDFRLSAGSPCIDAGNNFALPPNLLTDLDGFARLADDPDSPDTGNSDGSVGVVDMGAYEFGGDDCNNNGTPDPDDISNGTSLDCDANNVPDDCEHDCNGNGQADLCDIAAEISDDCDENLRPDACEIDQNSPAGGGPFYCAVATNSCDADCNVNGVPDACDVESEASADCDANGVPDECQPDCNDTGLIDPCDILQGFSDDCDGDLIPDECDPDPVITAQPTDQELEAGATFTFFAVQAEGVVLEFQWRKDGEELADGDRVLGSQSATLVIFDVLFEDAGSYDCEVTELLHDCVSLSDPATLTVLDPCPADLDGDGAVGVPDLIILLGVWGVCANPNDCPADFDNDGLIRVPDLIFLLGIWGACP